VLTRESKRQLDELHAKAAVQSSNGDEEGLKKTIAEAEPLIRAQLYKGFLVMIYAGMQENIEYQQKLLQPWLDRASPEERKAISDRVDAGYQELARRYAAALESKDYSITAAQPTFLALLVAVDSSQRFLDEKRNSLVKQQTPLPSPFVVEPLKREQPCTLSIAPKPGSTLPAVLASEFPSSQSYYPAEMERHSVSGDIVVGVEVSAMGCAESAKVAISSGVKELDEAALKLAMDGHYVPAAQGDKAVPGSFVFRVRFQL
jgi:TonB family protein